MSQPSDSTVPPDWAIQQAQSALQRGMSAPEVEQRLVAVGLAPNVATGAVERALGNPSKAPPLVDWAMEHARAGLRAGLKVPEIERQLVARGLTPEIAEAVVTNVLGERVRGGLAHTPNQASRPTLHRILSGVVGCLCILLGYWFRGGYSAGVAFAWILFPLALIWFPEVFRWAKYSRRGPASPVLVRWVGWFFLVLYCLYRLELVWFKP